MTPHSTVAPRRSIGMLAAVALAASVLVALQSRPAAAAPPDPVALRIVPDPWFSGHAGLYGWGMATLPNGNVLIGDYWNHRVQLYNKSGSLIDANYIRNPGYQACQHQSPYGLGVDPRNGDIYIADTDRRGVDKWSVSGETPQCVLSFGTQGAGPGKFKYPSRVAVADDGRVYVADTWDNQISVHQPNGSELFSFGSFGTANGQFKQPHGMAFDYGNDRSSAADDRLYVVNTNNFRVDVFDRNGGFLFKFGSKGSANGQFVGDMRGLAIDQSNDWVYVVDAAGNRVSKFDLNGNFLLRFGSQGTGNGQFSDGGREVTVDGNGNVWVGDMPNFRAQRFSPTGAFLAAVPNPPQTPPQGAFNGPRGVAVDADGNIFVTDTYNQRVQKLANNGAFIDEWGSRGRSGPYGFNYPRLIAVDRSDGSFVVADTDNHRIRKYSNTGTLLWSLGELGTSLGRFKNPHGIDVGPDGRIYVADTRNSRVQIISAAGNPLSQFGTKGGANGQFERPRGIGVDPATGDIYVADSTRDDVQRFSNGGGFISKIATKGSTDSTLTNPFDVQVAGGYVYVADTPKHKIKVFTTGGAFETAFGGRGKGLGKMIKPQGLDIRNGKLYVAEQSTAGTDSERIQIWSLTGGGEPPPPPPPGDLAYQDTLGGPGHAQMYPSGMEIAPNGDVIVADTGNSRIASYLPGGALEWEIGSFGAGQGAFGNPRDVGVDSAGRVYVADTANKRVVKLSATGNWLDAWKGPSADKIGSPMGLTVTGDTIYVADAGKQKVRVFDTSGNQLRAFGSNGACSFSKIRDVDADSNGNVYIANYTKNDILKMSSTGSCINTWGSKGTADGQFKNPYGVRLANDPVTGLELVYVADSNNNRIQVFRKGGAHQATFGSKGTYQQPGTFGSLRRVAVAGDGDVWGADLWEFRVERFNRTSTGWGYAQTIGGTPPPLTNASTFNEVRGVSFDAGGTLHAADTVNQRIVRMTTAGAVIDSCGKRGWALGQFNWPRSAAVDHATGNIWVADTKQSRLQLIADDCSGIQKVGSFGSALANFNWPHAIAIRQTDRIAVVADTNNHRVVAYDVQTRSPIGQIGGFGSGNGQFKKPRGIAVDPGTGRVFVADTVNDRIIELSVTGGGAFSWVRSFTGGFKRPEGVAAEGGRLFVADTNNGRVVVMDGSSGSVLESTTGPSGFDRPSAVAIGPSGKIYVSDTFNDRIQVYTYG